MQPTNEDGRSSPSARGKTQDTGRSPLLPSVVACAVVALLSALTPVMLVLPLRSFFRGEVSTTMDQLLTTMAIFACPLLAVFSMVLTAIGLHGTGFIHRFAIILVGIAVGLGLTALCASCIGDTNAPLTSMFVDRYILMMLAKTLTAIAVPAMILELATAYSLPARDRGRRFSIKDGLAVTACLAVVFSIPSFGLLVFFGPWGLHVGVVGSVWLGISATLSWLTCSENEGGPNAMRRFMAVLTLVVVHPIVWLVLATFVIQPSTGSFRYAIGFAEQPAVIATLVLFVIQLAVAWSVRRLGWRLGTPQIAIVENTGNISSVGGILPP